MKNGNGYTSQQIADAIRNARGFVTAAAQELGCSRRTVYRYLKKFAGAQESLEDAREKRHDFVENQLMKAVDKGNITAIIFYLKTQCKERGYIERYQQEVTGRDGGPMAFDAGAWREKREQRLAEVAATIAVVPDDGSDAVEEAVEVAEVAAANRRLAEIERQLSEMAGDNG